MVTTKAGPDIEKILATDSASISPRNHPVTVAFNGGGPSSLPHLLRYVIGVTNHVEGKTLRFCYTAPEMSFRFMSPSYENEQAWEHSTDTSIPDSDRRCCLAYPSHLHGRHPSAVLSGMRKFSHDKPNSPIDWQVTKKNSLRCYQMHSDGPPPRKIFKAP